MRIGLFVRYGRLDATYAFLQLAETLEAQGHCVSVYTDATSRVSVRADWDRRVILSQSRDFCSWASAQDVVVWSHCVDSLCVDWAARHGIKTGLVIFCDWFSPPLQQLQLFDFVAVPNAAMARQIKSSVAHHKLHVTPWCVGVPVTRKARINTPLELLVTYSGNQALTANAESLSLVMALLTHDAPLPPFRITIERQAWQGRVTRVFRKIQHRFRNDPRLRVVRGLAYEARLQLMGDSDLTILCGTSDAVGLYALHSLAMGTPVLGFSIPPLSDIVTHGRNGLLVPTKLERTTYCLSATDEPASFNKRVIAAVQQPELLLHMQQGCHTGLLLRNTAFAAAWTTILTKQRA